MFLLNPRHALPPLPRRPLPRAHREDHRVLRGQGKGPAPEGRPRPDLVRRLPRVRRAREALRHLPDPGAARRRGRALGHLAELRAERGARVLRASLLVHLAGHHPRPRPHLDERERGGQAPHRPPARREGASSASASRRRSTAPTSTPPTWSSSRPGTGGTWPAATSTTSATATRRRSCRSSGRSPGRRTTSSSSSIRSAPGTSSSRTWWRASPTWPSSCSTTTR